MNLSPEQLIAIGAAVVVGIIIIVIVAFFTRRDDSLVEVRLKQQEEEWSDYQIFKPEGDTGTSEEEESGSMLEDSRKKLLDPINNLLKDRKIGQNWSQQLKRANLKLTVAEYAVLHVASAAGFFTAGYLILWPGDLIMSIVLMIIGIFVPRIYVSRMVSKRLIAFEEQLPDTLSLWVNAIKAGYSVLQSMEAIARDSPEPTKTEFQRVVAEVQLGIDMSEALGHMLDRLDSQDLDLVVTAVNIQREVGGNLAEILEVIGHTIRERIKLKGEIRVLTSQGRITGYLISFLPIGLSLFLNFASPGYMGQLFASECGWMMIGVALALIGIGTAVIQKIIDIEI